MKEKALLIGVDFKNHSNRSSLETHWTIDDTLGELSELLKACDGETVSTITCSLQKPTANFLIGEGKVKEIAEFCQNNPVDVVIFSHDLKGSQQRNLEEAIGQRTIDRTQVILDIFARRARSQEGKMQVELAQLEYLLPRLTGKGVEMSRLGGGIGTRGPGETKLETDRRRLSERISKLKHWLREVASDRKLKRKKRQDHHIYGISLVGYTNAGKSTLLNTLTNAQTQTQDGVFTTLDSLSRQFVLPNHQKVVFSDTVGFMHDLPHHLIEAFKATLEEVQEADLLLHVLDISHPNFRNFDEAVCQVLEELGASDKPRITVLNKIDRLSDDAAKNLVESFPDSVLISALKGDNIDQLIQMISTMLSPNLVDIDVKIPISRMDLVNLVHKEGQVHSIKYLANTVRIRATVPPQVASKF